MTDPYTVGDTLAKYTAPLFFRGRFVGHLKAEYALALCALLNSAHRSNL